MITSISLTNYRNLSSFYTDLKNHTIVIAPNGAGKTNLLESLYYAMYGSSFKNLKSSADLIGYSQPFAKVSIELHSHQVEAVITQNENESVTRTFKKNNKQVGIKNIPGDLIFIVFSPNSVDLVNGSPDIRRNDLDMFISSLDDNYRNLYQRFKKVLKNKNALLKHIRDIADGYDQLEYWNSELAELASQIVLQRINHLHAINEETKQTYAELYSSVNSFEIVYVHNKTFPLESYKEALLEKYHTNREKEVMVGKTLYGPQKDEFDILLDNKSVRYFGSRGQQRIATLLVKLGHMKLASKNQRKPILLIDDIFSELDAKHREKIGDYLNQYKYQIIITSADKNEVPDILQKDSTMITL